VQAVHDRQQVLLVRFAWQDQPGELAMWSGADP